MFVSKLLLVKGTGHGEILPTLLSHVNDIMFDIIHLI